MRRLTVRVLQVAILAVLAWGMPAPRAQASDISCYVICLGLDWDCILRTGHPAEPCSYDADHDICNVGGCWLPQMQ